jgi:uncharacterized protein (DUF952 family)
MAIIFHITTADAWQAAQAQASYTADSLASEGFIHCSKLEQIVATANHYYAGQRGHLLLAIAPGRVAAEVRFENTSGGTELFPHIYGPLNLDAVMAALPFEPDADGQFYRLPENTPVG